MLPAPVAMRVGITLSHVWIRGVKSSSLFKQDRRLSSQQPLTKETEERVHLLIGILDLRCCGYMKALKAKVNGKLSM